jgi:hypothetical protein
MLWGNGGRYRQKSSERASLWEEQTCLDCLIIKNRLEVDREKAGRFIHHVQWLHPASFFLLFYHGVISPLLY